MALIIQRYIHCSDFRFHRAVLTDI
jgi:hypothetical protein